MPSSSVTKVNKSRTTRNSQKVATLAEEEAVIQAVLEASKISNMANNHEKQPDANRDTRPPEAGSSSKTLNRDKSPGSGHKHSSHNSHKHDKKSSSGKSKERHRHKRSRSRGRSRSVQSGHSSSRESSYSPTPKKSRGSHKSHRSSHSPDMSQQNILPYPNYNLPPYGFPPYQWQPMFQPPPPLQQSFGDSDNISPIQHGPVHPISSSEDEDEDSCLNEGDDKISTVSNLSKLFETGELEKACKEDAGLQLEEDKTGPDVENFFKNMVETYLNKPQLSNVDAILSDFPRPGNIDWLKAPKLDNAVFRTISAKNRNYDIKLRKSQQYLNAATTACISVLKHLIKKEKSDPEMSIPGLALKKAIKLICYVSQETNTRRKDALRQVVNQDYASVFSRKTDPSPDWLLGGVMMEHMKECEDQQKLRTKLRKPKPKQKEFQGKKQGPQNYRRGRGNYYQDRFSQGQQNFQQFPQYQQGYNMGYYQQQQPQNYYQQFHQQPNFGFGGYRPRFSGPRYPQNADQNFQKQGNAKKQ